MSWPAAIPNGRSSYWAQSTAVAARFCWIGWPRDPQPVRAEPDSFRGNDRFVGGKAGTLRQFIKNANAIGTAGSTTANYSQFRMQVAANLLVRRRGKVASVAAEDRRSIPHWRRIS